MFRPRTVLAILAALVLAAAVTVVVIVVDSGSSATKRPNVVFVLTDDLSTDLVHYMPAVHAMEHRGTSFSNYYVVDSLCCPSRTSILTGEYPHDDGVFTNAGSDGGYNAFQAHHDQDRTFAVTLQKRGYRTALMGKYLNLYEPRDPVPTAWNEWDVSGGGGYKEFDYGLNQNGTIHTFGHAASDYLVDVMAKRGASFIRSSAKAKKPFVLELATFAPHAPYTPAPRYAASFPGIRYPRTPAYGTIPTDPPAYLAHQPRLTPKDEQTIDTDFQLRVRAVQAVDDMIRTVERTLTAAGVADDTYVVFSSDNGFHMGENRLPPGKQTPFDTDIHVPLVVVGPHVPAGRKVTQLASNIDLAPTFDQLAGAPVPSTVDGVSLVPLLHGGNPSSWQQAVLVEHHQEQVTSGDPDAQRPGRGDPPSYQAIRTSSALYVLYPATGAQEYYLTGPDPYERHNLAASGVPAKLKSALAALTACHGAARCQSAARLT